MKLPIVLFAILCVLLLTEAESIWWPRYPPSPPTVSPSFSPSFSSLPTTTPSSSPSLVPSTFPSDPPSAAPSITPTAIPSSTPSFTPSSAPSSNHSSQLRKGFSSGSTVRVALLASILAVTGYVCLLLAALFLVRLTSPKQEDESRNSKDDYTVDPDS